MKHIKQLDAFRFFAFMGVFIAHSYKIDNKLFHQIPFGYGVNLFFVLSGFLITGILLDDREDSTLKKGKALRNFYIRRALRIFPIYYGTVLFLYYIKFQNYEEVTPWLLCYAANIHIWLQLPYMGSYNHLWSLGIEEQFYLVWPFIILFFPKKHLLKVIYLAIFVSLAFKIGLYLYIGHWHPAINAATISYIDAFGMGGLIAYWKRHNVQWLEKGSKYSKWLLLLMFTLFMTMKFNIEQPFFHVMDDIFANALFGFISFLILLPASHDAYSGWFKKVLDNKIIIHLGKISYGLYLYHLFVQDFYNYLVEKELLPEVNPHIRFWIYFLLCLVIAELTWFLIEQPIGRLKKYFPNGRNNKPDQSSLNALPESQ